MKNNDYEFAIIRFNEDKITAVDSTFISRLDKYANKEGFNYYINNTEYKNINPEELKNIKYALVFTYKSNKESKLTYSKIYWCKFKFEYGKPNNKAVLIALYDTDSDIVIENAASSILLDIENDFEEDKYITIEYSPKIFEQFKIFNKTNTTTPFNEPVYKAKESEKELDSLAQRNEYCLRVYNLKIPTADDRTEYQRDYDRILYSKAFRRLADKTQVFSSSKGDHYRIRMTHTMIVCQIARSISDALKLNTSLTEAIALGHDLGHTPFGHVGERTLNDILNSKDKSVGGFKHNYQGLRVVSKLENQYTDIDGLDLSYQVLDGIYKHTSAADDVCLEKLIDDEDLIHYISQSSQAVTLEGQVVAVADEIAQRSHDIDDAITSKLLTLEEFNNYLELNKFKNLKDKIDEVENRLDNENIKIISDKTELISAQISSAIIKFFIKDVIDESKLRIKDFKENNGEKLGTPYIISEKLISFSKDGERICDYLEKVVNNSIITSNEVSTTDQNSKLIIEALFKAYLNDPKLLHTGTKKRIYADFFNKYDKGIKNLIPLTESNYKALTKEFNNIIACDPDIIKTKKAKEQEDDETEKEKTEEKENTDSSNNEDIKEPTEEYKLKYKILLRNICDFIAGMTDTYALNEYKKIYQNTLFGN